MRAHKVKTWLLQTLAVLAYLTIVLQWLIVFMPYIPSLAQTDVFDSFVPDSTPQTQPDETQVDNMPQWAVFLIVGSILGVMIVVAAMSLRRAPKAIGEVGHMVTHKAAEAIVPVVTHHHPITPRKRKVITTEVVFGLKALIVCAPVVFVLVAPFPEGPSQLTRDVVLIVAAGLAAWTLLLFGIQLSLARLLHISTEKLW